MKVFVAALLASAAVVATAQDCTSQSCGAGNYCDSLGDCESCAAGSIGTNNPYLFTVCPSDCTDCTDDTSDYSYSSYDYSQCDEDALKFWYNAIRTTVWLGLFLMAIPSIVLGCLPACCGKMVEQRKPLGGAAIGLGIFAIFMPAIGGLTGGNGACEKMCKEAECSDYSHCLDDQGMEDCKAAFSALGIIVAYTIALGFLPMICGIVGASMGCAACAGCCKANPNAGGAAAGGAPVVQGAVVQGAVVKQ